MLDIELQRGSNMSVNVAKREQQSQAEESSTYNQNKSDRYSNYNSVMRHRPQPGVILGNISRTQYSSREHQPEPTMSDIKKQSQYVKKHREEGVDLHSSEKSIDFKCRFTELTTFKNSKKAPTKLDLRP